MAAKVIPIRQATSLVEFQIAPEFNIVSELSLNRQAYIGGEPCSISGVPTYVTYAIDRVREKVPGSLFVSPVVACCIVYALPTIIEREEVLDLKAARKSLNSVDSDKPDLVVLTHTILKQIPLNVSQDDMLGTTTLKIRLPEATKVRLMEESASVGMNASALGIVCIMETLGGQSCVMKEHRRSMEKSVNKFQERLRLQAVVARTLIDELKRGQK